MNIKFTAIAAAALAFSAVANAGNYKLTVPYTADEDGAMVFLVNYDSGEKIDSVMVHDAKAVFEGTVAKPVLARVVMDGKRSGVFVLEDGTLTMDTPYSVTGSPLNDRMKAIQEKISGIAARFNDARGKNDQAAGEAIYKEYQDYLQQTMVENSDNPIGVNMFLETAYELSPEEFDAALAKYPQFKSSKRVQKLIAANQAKAATKAGAMFTDFEVTYDGKTHKLSDVVGKGTPVLVDFWASWCGPCRREMPNLKKIYHTYGNKLKVLGVAVWDEPDASLKAVKDMSLPWEVWVNGQTAPTDAYGISGIPCIVVFNGDGSIAFRDKVGEDLTAALQSLIK